MTYSPILDRAANGKSRQRAEGKLWNPNGRELFYREGSKMMAVDVTTEPAFSAGKPKMLFDGVDPGWQTDRISLEPGRSREHLLAIGRR